MKFSLRGPQGPPGDPGMDGATGPPPDVNKLVDEILEKVVLGLEHRLLPEGGDPGDVLEKVGREWGDTRFVSLDGWKTATVRWLDELVNERVKRLVESWALRESDEVVPDHRYGSWMARVSDVTQARQAWRDELRRLETDYWRLRLWSEAVDERFDTVEEKLEEKNE